MKISHKICGVNKAQFEHLYGVYNARKWVHPDPLEFLYDYPDRLDREVVGLIASCLAYGRVTQILRSVSGVLKEMGPSPRRFLQASTPASLRMAFGNFKHRFTCGEDLVMMLLGIKRAIERYGSIYSCFLSGLKQDDKTILPAVSFLVKELGTSSNNGCNTLLPLPEKGSACKRLNLFLRWMVREDQVDPGGWHQVNPNQLIVPLDTHMHRICVRLNMTSRKNADMRTALEVTRVFGKMAPEDPVRYDFALTRLGIRKDADLGQLFASARIKHRGPTAHRLMER